VRHLDLFSGIGGFALGLNRAGFETVAFCEIDPFCQRILKKHWPDVPIIEDVKDAEKFDAIGDVEIITGGYPCQPWSAAGLKRGEADDRHLWPAMFEVIKRKRPTWVIGENVAGHASMGLDQVLTDLEAEDYQARAFIIPACAVDSHQKRDRCWILAHSQSRRSGGGGSEEHRIDKRFVFEEEQEGRKVWSEIEGCGLLHRWDETQSPVRGMADGVPDWVDRVKSLGNAVVPKIPEIIGKAIMEIERGT
jgi:DNA (cytosine-5)-methyltransferase 1